MTASKPPAEGTPSHTDHPLRHYDRTCPGCQAEVTPVEGTPRVPSNHVVKVEFFSNGDLLTKYADGTDELFDANPATRWLQIELQAERQRCEEFRVNMQAQHDTCELVSKQRDSWKDRAEQAESRAASAEKDAGRYRWLRATGYYDADIPMNFHCSFPATCYRYETLAAAIDAASGEAG